MRELDLFLPLSGGTTIIEAAAGTGKTYSIAALFLRLLVEQQVPVDGILVVTFTEAATKELRERIRERIRSSIALFSGEGPTDDFMAELLRRNPDHQRARTLLTLALASFDGAAIHTIHGFCSRILQENAFECNALFDTELMTDQSDMLRELAEDAWRRHFYCADELFISYCLNNGCSVDSLLGLIRLAVTRPGIAVQPVLHHVNPELCLNECRAAFTDLQCAWRSGRERLRDLLEGNAASLNQNSYRMTSIAGWCDELDRFMAGDDPLDIPAKLRKFTVAAVTAATRKGMAPPADPFFDLCGSFLESAAELASVYAHNLLAVRAEVAVCARAMLAARKEQRNLRSYDDLLHAVHAALQRDADGWLRERIVSRFRGGLIDEFQDTDPVQYEIFSGIFRDSGAPLVFIGDPKQAIYSFRGADLYAYLAAVRGRKDESHTLLRNWRSTAPLLSAFNTLFSGDLPFLLPEIEYRAVTAGRVAANDPGDSGDAPFVINCFPSDDGKPLAKVAAEQLAAAATAGEIVRLLSAEDSDVLPVGGTLGAGDIAVLVRKNHQGRLVQEALARVGIPSVLHGTESLFRAHEVKELHRLLVALHDPGNGRKLRTALATDMLGWSAANLVGIDTGSAPWTELLERFRRYHLLWLRQGVMVMVMELLTQEGVRPRLLAFRDGERRLTNLLHAVELLHRVEQERDLGGEGLTSWLAAHIVEPPDIDEYQLRLETDVSAVQVVTIHRSKGLEYPVVFCPFAWEGVRTPQIPVFHEEGSLVLDLGSESFDTSIRAAREEQFAEDLRLLYVALTRARFRCYLHWGRFSGADSSALAYLLFRPHLAAGADPVVTTEDSLSGLDHNAEQAALQLLAERSGGAICLQIGELPADIPVDCQANAYEQLAPRSFCGEIDRTWRVASFTGLTSGAPHAAELPDRDALQAGESMDELFSELPAGSMFGFPRGARAGTCLHAILEQTDFSRCNRTELLPMIEGQMQRHGFPVNWRDTVAAMVAEVVRAPLNVCGDEVTLSQLAAGSWIPEMEFMLPLDAITPDSLAALFRRHGVGSEFPDMLAELQFTRVKGMLRGFIDMVFRINGRYCLIDWKSNHLGNRPADYAPHLLNGVMEREFYTLQYHLYTVALHRYLSFRLPGYDYEDHFGGVFYLFLRGVQRTSPGTGIYSARPQRELILELAELLDPHCGGMHG